MTNQWPANAPQSVEAPKKSKKPWYKKWWVWLIVAIVIIGIAGSRGNEDGSSPGTSTVTSTAAQGASEASQASAPPSKEKEADVPKEYKNALRSAKRYPDTVHMSKQGIYDQLTSQFEQFTSEEAQYAVDNL
ncbi:MAG: Ltp family lipoprotein [Corynebacterium glucuronolyticum]|nr:Ltp family lipoprotein [Mycobacteriaceae bacterium]MDY5834732.1 Ltp family lipoprotein [Corynebacterium glucuronolyticum]